ncbi:MAG: NAD-dependent epimerase/dehydratase family protein, partial [Candidatus Thermoplasmatota archaeon]
MIAIKSNDVKESKINNSTMVVTGGAGFIGSHLVDRLVDDGYRVVVVDDLSSGKLGNIGHHFGKELDRFYTNKEDIEKRKKDGMLVESSVEDVVLALGDIRGFAFLKGLFEKYKPCWVFHLAAMVSVPRSMDDPCLCNSVNVDGCLNVLMASRCVDVEKVVFSSSCAVYGNPSEGDLPLSEDNSLDPLSSYAASKVMGEMYCRLFSRVYGLGCVVLRYFNVFGPRQDPGGGY